MSHQLPDTVGTPEISVVLPCYRAAPVAQQSVAELSRFFEGTTHTWEVIVVDDGGHDFPDPPWPVHSCVRLLRLSPNQGKGAAVIAGMLAARGRVRVFTDVDLPYGLDLLPVMRHYILVSGFHLVVGDRTLPTSVYGQVLSWKRRLASSIYSQFVGRLVTGGFHDTQCGLKAVRGDVADLVFPLLQLRRFAFDVELIYIALKHRADIKRIPVQLQSNMKSTVRLWRDSFTGVADIMRIKANQLRGRYDSPELRRLLLSDFRQAQTEARFDRQLPA